MYKARLWSVNHARFLQRVYDLLERIFTGFHPLFQKIGYDRLEQPVAFVERNIKGIMFDCKMCGNCVLNSSGMSCPMNCPKQLRNGPCGGVRANGHCEVDADMLCVWVEAERGSRMLPDGDRINLLQGPLDRSLEGRSSWLREVRRQAEQRAIEVAA